MKFTEIISFSVLVVPGLALGQLSFEQYQGYAVGELENSALSVDAGSASITNSRMLDGSQSAWLESNKDGLSTAWQYDPLEGMPVTYFSFAMDTPLVEQGAVYKLTIGGAYMGLSQQDGELSLLVYDTTIENNGGTVGQPYEVFSRSLTEEQSWSRLTIRFDHEAGYFDCYVDGKMVAADFPFSARGDSFTLESACPSELYLDRLAHLTRPLDFEDADLDGLPDAWEREHGLSLSSNDRYADQDGDGDVNVLELINGGNPANQPENVDGTQAANEGLTIFLNRRGYFTLTEDVDRSPLFPKF